MRKERQGGEEFMVDSTPCGEPPQEAVVGWCGRGS